MKQKRHENRLILKGTIFDTLVCFILRSPNRVRYHPANSGEYRATHVNHVTTSTLLCDHCHRTRWGVLLSCLLSGIKGTSRRWSVRGRSAPKRYRSCAVLHCIATPSWRSVTHWASFQRRGRGGSASYTQRRISEAY